MPHKENTSFITGAQRGATVLKEVFFGIVGWRPTWGANYKGCVLRVSFIVLLFFSTYQIV